MSSSVVERICEAFPGAVEARATGDADLAVRVIASPSKSPSTLVELMPFVRRDPALAFDGLLDLFAVDRLPRTPRFEVVYRLWSREHAVALRVHSGVDGDAPTVPSVVSLWPSAAWMEREAFDLLGVRFGGHPELRRILQADDAEGFPLRRDVGNGGRP